MSPGLSVDKHVLSSNDLKRHSKDIHDYSAEDIVQALDRDGFDAIMRNPNAEKEVEEKMDELVCFGSKEVRPFSYIKTLISQPVTLSIRSELFWFLGQ